MRTFRLVLVTVGLALMTLATGARAEAAPIYLTTPLALAQTNLQHVPSGPGKEVWTTTFVYTNNTGAELKDVNLWYAGARLFYTLTEVTPTTWDGAAQQWTTAHGQTMTAYNNTGFRQVGLSNLDIDPIFGVDQSESLPVWSLGDLAMGQSVTVMLARETSDNVLGFRSAGGLFVTHTVPDPTPVPEPATVMLVGAGLAAAFVTRRRSAQSS